MDSNIGWRSCDADEEHSVLEFRGDMGGGQVIGKFDDALETALRNLHAITAAAFFDQGVAPLAANRDVAIV